jgi:hypothetical protein
MAYRTTPPLPPQPDRRANIAAARKVAAKQDKEETKMTGLAALGALTLFAGACVVAVALDVLGAHVIQQALIGYGIRGGGLQAPFLLLVTAQGVVATGVVMGGNRVVTSAIKKIKREMDKEDGKA